MASPEDKKLHSITGVEVFAAGKWNGDEYTVADLDEMVRAFNENKARIKPSLKLGHDPDQKLLQKDGYPAAGWIGRLYREGSKLVADFVDMPEKIYELVKRRAYRKVSSEIYWNIEVAGRKYKRFLSAVSMLGGDMPAVGCLDDIMALYGVRKADRLGTYATGGAELTIKTYTVDLSSEATRMSKTEAEIKLEVELKQAQEESKSYSEELAEKKSAIAEKEKEIETLRKFKEESEKRAAEAEKLAAETKLDSFVSEMEKEGLVTLAMKPYVRQLIGEDKKEYSFDGDKKKISKQEVMREILKLHAAAEAVNFSENGKRGDDTGSKAKESDLDQKIRKYAADNKVTYGDAYRAILKQEKK